MSENGMSFTLIVGFLILSFPCASSEKSLTAYENFDNVCIKTVSAPFSNGSDARDLLSDFYGKCVSKRDPMVFGVTHENDRNNHLGALNYRPDIRSYMADYELVDLGRWLKLEVDDSTKPRRISLELDTRNNKVNVTGWPIRFGHLFIGLSDKSVHYPLNRPIYVEFDARITTHYLPKGGTRENGRRVLFGALLTWREAPPRTNVSHFLEVNLVLSDGFSASYNSPDYSLCHDVAYDRCFYSTGSYPEGREVSYKTASDTTQASRDAEWLHVSIPLVQLARKLRWVSPPESWDHAEVRAVYFGVESTGAAWTQAQFRNYKVRSEPGE